MSRAGDPGARGSTRRARAIVKSARSPSSSAPARDLLRPRKWNATVKAGACRLRLAGSRCGNAPRSQRSRHYLVVLPRATGRRQRGESLARARGSTARGCVRASNRLQKSANDAEVQRSAIPLAKGRVDGDPSSVVLARAPRSGKGVDNWYRGGKATAPWKSEPGVRKGTAGRRPSQDGRHPGSSHESLVHAGGSEGDLGGSRESGARERHVAPGRGDRDVRGKACTRRDGKKTPAALR